MNPDPSRRCSICGGERMSWHLHRAGTRPLRSSARAIRWMCRDCGAERIEALPSYGGHMPDGAPPPDPTR